MRQTFAQELWRGKRNIIGHNKTERGGSGQRPIHIRRHSRFQRTAKNRGQLSNRLAHTFQRTFERRW